MTVSRRSAAPRASDHGVDLAVYDGVLGAVHEKEGESVTTFRTSSTKCEDS